MIHWQETAMLIPMERMAFGKTSATSVHVTGPGRGNGHGQQTFSQVTPKKEGAMGMIFNQSVVIICITQRVNINQFLPQNRGH